MARSEMKLPRGYCERRSRSVKVVFLATRPAQRSCLLGALYQFAKEKTNSAAWIALLAGPQRFFQSSCRSTSLESSGAQRASKERAWSDTSIFKLICLGKLAGVPNFSKEVVVPYIWLENEKGRSYVFSNQVSASFDTSTIPNPLSIHFDCFADPHQSSVFTVHREQARKEPGWTPEHEK